MLIFIALILSIGMGVIVSFTSFIVEYIAKNYFNVKIDIFRDIYY